MKRSRPGYSQPRPSSPSSGLTSGEALSRAQRVPVTPTKAGTKGFASPLRRRQSVGGGAEAAVSAAGAPASSIVPPSLLCTADQVRVPLSRLQESAAYTAKGVGSGAQQRKLAPQSFQSPSKSRGGAGAGAVAMAISSPPTSPLVAGGGGAMRVLTPAKKAAAATATRSSSSCRVSLGGTKKRRISGSSSGSSSGHGKRSEGFAVPAVAALAGKQNPSERGETPGSTSTAAAPTAAGGAVKRSGSREYSSKNLYGTARRVSTFSNRSGGSSQDGEEDDRENSEPYPDGTTDAYTDADAAVDPEFESAAGRVSARRRGGGSGGGGGERARGFNETNLGGKEQSLFASHSKGSSSSSAAAISRRASGSHSSVSKVSAVAAAGGSTCRGGTETTSSVSEGTKVHPRPPAAATEPANFSAWRPLGEISDFGKPAPRRVSTWSNNSGGSSSSSTASDVPVAASSSSSGGRARLSITAAREGSAAAGAGAGRVRNRSTTTATTSGGGGGGGGGGVSEGGPENNVVGKGLARRVSSGRYLVGVCQACGERRKSEREREGPSCERCATGFPAEEAEKRVAASRPRGTMSAFSAVPGRKRSIVQAPSAEAIGGGGGGGAVGASAESDGADLKRRVCIQDFQVTSALGQGKFGSVYKAKVKRSHRTVAIKMIIKSTLRIGGPQDIVNLNRERILQARLLHPNIVRMQTCFQDAKFIYLVLDYASGGDVYKLLSQERNARGLPGEMAASYLSDAVSAVDYLHSVDIIHRDIKAENLLLDSKGRLKLSDFGWAVHARPPHEHRRRTMCGTPEYAPPEMLVRSPEYTKAVDIWSLGVLAFELLTGHTPFSKPHTSATPTSADNTSSAANISGSSSSSGNSATDGNASASVTPCSPSNGWGPTGTGGVAVASSCAEPSVVAAIEELHKGDSHAKLYGRIAGWGGSRDSLFGGGSRGADVPDRAQDVVMAMLRPRPEDRLKSGEILRLPWVALRGRGAAASSSF